MKLDIANQNAIGKFTCRPLAEEIGLVRRAQSEDDARSVVVALTVEGESLRGRFDVISKKLVSRIYGPLEKSEGEMLEKLLNRVLSNLEAAKRT